MPKSVTRLASLGCSGTTTGSGSRTSSRRMSSRFAGSSAFSGRWMVATT